MCEPTHSIVAYPDEDDRGPTQTTIETAHEAVPSRRSGLGGIWDMIKKFGNWFHLSKLGKGHSEAIGTFRPYVDTYLMPQPVLYESLWWCRQVKLDSLFPTRRKFDDLMPHYSKEWQRIEQAEALECATKYARITSIGSLKMFRDFFEGSIKLTERPEMYFEHFIDNMLNSKARISARAMIRKITGGMTDITRALCSSRGYYYEEAVNNGKRPPTFETVERWKKQLLALCLGLTRKREALVPEWADDTALWVPQGAPT